MANIMSTHEELPFLARNVVTLVGLLYLLTNCMRIADN